MQAGSQLFLSPMVSGKATTSGVSSQHAAFRQPAREGTLSHGLSPLLVLMLFVSSARGRYGFVKTSGPVGKGEDG